MRPGLRGEGASQGGALLLATGEFVRVAAGEAVEAGEAHRLLDAAGRAFGAGQAEADVPRDRKMREQSPFLRHIADPALFRRDRGQDPAIQRDLPCIRLLEPGDQAQQRRLPAAGCAEQGKNRAAGNGEVDAAQDRRAVKLLLQPRDRQVGHRAR